MLCMTATDGAARLLFGRYGVVVEDGVVVARFVGWGLIGSGGQNRKIIYSTVLSNRYLNSFLFVCVSPGD